MSSWRWIRYGNKSAKEISRTITEGLNQISQIKATKMFLLIITLIDL